MVCSFVSKQRVRVSSLRAHLCTLAVAMSLNAWWRVPRDAFRYGGLAYGLALTVAALAVATPAALLQLALGQLCQQGIVGMWRAVPFFTGVGYLRLLITSLSAVYTIIHLALITTNFFFILSTQGSVNECTELVIPEDINKDSVTNSSILCYTESPVAPVGEEPGYYTAVALLIASFWIVLPFLLYNPVKFMKRIFYVLGPLVLVLGVVIVSCVGAWADVVTVQKRSDWPNFLNPNIWHAAIIQSLCSTQIAGGYLASTGDAIYSNNNVQWTTLTIVGTNVVSSWMGLLFWFAVGGNNEKDTSLVAIIYQVHNLVEEKHLDRPWPLVIFFTLALSGVITMLALLYPLYDRFRLVGGVRWRVLTAASSVLGLAAALAVLATKLAALHLLEDVALPLLISLTTVLEISAFLFIYGWKILIEDIEFLAGQTLSKYWMMGWCVALGVVAPISAWWVTMVMMGDGGWSQPPYIASTVVATAATALVVLFVCAAIAVAKQVQYDFIAKLKSSFVPSRRWGPRDPITHYYWVLRREEAERGVAPRAPFHRQLTLHATPRTLATVTATLPSLPSRNERRSNSDDWFYTVYRRQFLKQSDQGDTNKKRSKSLDFNFATIKKPNFHDVERDLHIYSKICKESKNEAMM